MRTEKQISDKITEIYDRANAAVDIDNVNAKQAKIQIESTAMIKALSWVIDELHEI